ASPYPPVASDVTPKRAKYDSHTSATIAGQFFNSGPDVRVTVNGRPARRVVVVDRSTITCLLPPGTPGPASIRVENSAGAGQLDAAFLYTPCIAKVEGNLKPGGVLVLDELCEPGDSLFGVYGLRPETKIATPPFDNFLAIDPCYPLFFERSWPFDEFLWDE